MKWFPDKRYFLYNSSHITACIHQIKTNYYSATNPYFLILKILLFLEPQPDLSLLYQKYKLVNPDYELFLNERHVDG
jgi:hypothetical protein